jgi:hypothetical protein
MAAAIGTNLTLAGSFAGGERRLSTETKSREIEKAIDFGVRRVEAYRRDKDALPPDLASVGLNAADGWTYQATGTAGYTLGLSFGGEYGIFESSSRTFVFASGKGKK